jgi:hypothetical protein
LKPSQGVSEEINMIRKSPTKITTRQVMSIFLCKNLALEGQPNALDFSIAKSLGISIKEAEKLSPVKKAAYLSLLREDLLEQYPDLKVAPDAPFEGIRSFCEKYEKYIYITYTHKKAGTPPVYPEVLPPTSGLTRGGSYVM